MNLLIVTGRYPHETKPTRGVILEKNTLCLNSLADQLVVLSPRFLLPSFISSFEKWRRYTDIPRQYEHNGIRVFRPAYIFLPYVGLNFWRGWSAFWFSRSTAASLHRKISFDAVISFDLLEAGELAWRLGKYLKIPACSWAFGTDVYSTVRNKVHRKTLNRTLGNLNLVFYQNNELRSIAIRQYGEDTSASKQLNPDNHIVLPHGIPLPELLPDDSVRIRKRGELQVGDGQIMVLYVGRITREKGAFDIYNAMKLLLSNRDDIRCVMIGARPVEDNSDELRFEIEKSGLVDRVKVLQFCKPDELKDFLAAADIYAFASYHEGMPNSLLEAMHAKLPVVAYDIAPVLEVKNNKNVILTAPLRDVDGLKRNIEILADDAELRCKIGTEARKVVTDRFSVSKNMALAMKYIEKVVLQHDSTV